MSKTERVGVFDADGVLVGEKHKPANKIAKKDFLIGDQKVDGTYRLVDGQLIPVGHGHGKPSAQRVSRDRAVYLLMTALLNETPIPEECREWCHWFETWGR